MKTALFILAALGMLTLVTVSKGGDPVTPRKPIVGPEWKSVEESIVLPNGVKAQATYHFNRNGLSNACLTEDGLLAVTDSGNLLRFDLKELRLQQEIRPDSAIALLTKVEGIGVVAACADGHLFRIDPKTLKQTEFSKLPKAPKWMTGFQDAATKKHGLLAIVLLSGGEIDVHWLGFDQPRSEKHKVPSLFPARGDFSAFFVDRKSRLWLGIDSGEWGGWCGNLDLNAGKDAKIENLKDHVPSGVYGFVELPDGQIWAYGGMVHFSASGFIARVDRGKCEVLGSFFNDQLAKPDIPPKLPQYPITHIIPDPKGDGLLVFAYSDLFRVNNDLTHWRYMCKIELRYRWGRPDAMGSYPALRAVLAVPDKSGDIIGITARDGVLRINEGQVTQYVVPGQIGDNVIGSVLPAVGTSLLSGEDLWSYTAGRWQAMSLYPSTPPGPHESWYESSLMLDPQRRPVALCGSNSSPGMRALTRLTDGKVEILASESGRILDHAKGGFATPDDSYWCADRGKLLRLVDGKWQHIGKVSDEYLWGIRVVGHATAPWTLHNKSSLYRLTPANGKIDAAITPLVLPAQLGKVDDALALKDGSMLLACTAGLRRYDEKTGIVSECLFTPPKGEVRALCLDGRGRIWLAGSSLWMVDTKGKVHDLGKLNRYGVPLHVIGADSTDPNGVIVGMGQRGVLFVSAEVVDR